MVTCQPAIAGSGNVVVAGVVNVEWQSLALTPCLSESYVTLPNPADRKFMYVSKVANRCGGFGVA